ncbi:MAG: DnaJ domain-containing protein [Desulfobacteraceae bacterium]|nr:DnaJ domain-containing protein [Desulfobacteraceae bacterium]
MSVIIPAEPELVHACRILFGSELQVNRDFLEYLQLQGVKSAFRRKALETHPDRVAIEGALAQDRHAALFREVQQAYEQLSAFLNAREKGYRLPPLRPFADPAFSFTASRSPRNGTSQEGFRGGFRRQPGPERSGGIRNGSRPPGERFYEGPLPQRPLLFGHYLYYSGMITWRMIIQALIWQRMQRPRLGQLGQRFGWLTTEGVLQVLRDSRYSRPFGQTALDLGLLNERQLKILLFQQKRLQKKIGEFFLQEGILTPAQLNDLLARCQEHNARLAAAVFSTRF